MDDHALREHIRFRFESSVGECVRRASAVRLHPFIPGHWFAAAASESTQMYVAGYFYGAISIAQAYVEALSIFLVSQHSMKVGKDPLARYGRLYKQGIISANANSAAVEIMNRRNDFHHLNASVPQDYHELQSRAERCINSLYTIESEIFSFTVNEPGVVTPSRPDYWPVVGPGQMRAFIRQL